MIPTAWGLLLDALLPSVCPACQHRSGTRLCDPCRGRLRLIRHPCPQCAAPRRDDLTPCANCQGRGMPNIERVSVRWSYEGVVRDLVGRAKAGGQAAAVRALCELLTPDETGDLVVPIPAARNRRNGPHLASALAATTARSLHLQCRRGLAWQQQPAPQHRLGIGERKRNVDGNLRWRGRPPTGRVILVDDLLTSGATLVAAARCLRAAGASGVRAICLARTPHPKEVAAVVAVPPPPSVASSSEADNPDGESPCPHLSCSQPPAAPRSISSATRSGSN